MKPISLLSASLALAAISSGLACSGDARPLIERGQFAVGVNTGKCNLINLSVVDDTKMAGILDGSLKDKNSPLKDKLLQILPSAPSCDLGGVTAALKAAHCSTETAMVSETAQMVGLVAGPEAVSDENSFYRFVVRSQCDDLPDFGLLLSPLAGVRVRANGGAGDQATCKSEIDGRADGSTPLSVACTDDGLKALCAAGDAKACFGADFNLPKACFDSSLTPAQRATIADQDFANDVTSDFSQARCFKAVTNLATAGVEIIASQLTPPDPKTPGKFTSNGVFNYYEASSQGLKYFGSSDQFDDDYTDQTTVDATRQHSQDIFGGLKGTVNVAGRANSRGKCSACHPGGGLVMKELASPWVHWEHFTSTPGAGAIRNAAPNIVCASPTADNSKGCTSFMDGAGLEPIIDEGNHAAARAKIARLRAAGNLRALLRPLFCVGEMNIGSAGGVRATAGQAPSDLFLGGNALLDPAFANLNLQIPSSVYRGANGTGGVRDQLGQRVEGVPTDASGNPPDDTFFELTFLERGRMDVNYIGLNDQSPIDNPTFDDSFAPSSSLVGLGVISPSVARAILAVDMGRPFSDARCALIDALPKSGESFLATGNGDAKAAAAAGVATQLKARLIALLGNQGAAGARLGELLAADVPLDKPAQFGAQTQLDAQLELATADMAQRCAFRMLRDPVGMTTDALTVIHNHLNIAQGEGASGGFAFIEGPGTMIPTSDVSGEDAYLSPVDCSLQRGPTMVDPKIDFCTTVSSPGFWCYDSFKAADWGGAVERPAANQVVFCGKDKSHDNPPGPNNLGKVTGLDSGCFNGCRRMIDGQDDQCNSALQIPFNIVQLNPGKTVKSFCDVPPDVDGSSKAQRSAGKDRFVVNEFGGVSRMWCKTSCTGDFIDANGALQERGTANGVIEASCQ